MNINYKMIGARIKETRKAKKMTQETLAEKLSVTVGYISQLERGSTKINLEILSKICALLDCDIAYLVSGVNTAAQDYLHDELLEKLSRLTSGQKQLVSDLVDSIIKNT